MRKILLIAVSCMIASSCSSIDKSKMERQIIVEGKFDCETGEYYQAHSEKIPNEHSADPNATIMHEEYACARRGKVPKGKEIKSFEELQELRDTNRETMFMLFAPCKYVTSKHICNY